jgi:hypothetical protein
MINKRPEALYEVKGLLEALEMTSGGPETHSKDKLENLDLDASRLALALQRLRPSQIYND